MSQVEPGYKVNMVTLYKSYAEHTEDEFTIKPFKFLAPNEGERWDQLRGYALFTGVPNI
jgi:hypothetical protein